MEERQDLISRQAVLNMLHRECSTFVEDFLRNKVKALPSAQPGIIRCKDCKHIQKWRSEESAKKFGQIYECGKMCLIALTQKIFVAEQKGEPMEIKLPIQINLPNDWVEQIVNRLKNDPEAEWVEIIRCKDCKHYCPMNKETKTGICNLTIHQNFGDNWFCAGAERKDDDCI